MAYADYEFYTNEYGGKAISEEDFPFWANRAAALIDAVTRGAAAQAEGNVLYQVKMANCALAENVRYEDALNASTFSETGQVSSESVGSWSRSFSAKTVSSVDIDLLDKRRREILLIYLGNTGIMRSLRPVRRCCR